MRPRPEGRGELCYNEIGNGEQPELQCGHDPKAVENEQLLGLCGHAGLLQCGHDPKAVENALVFCTVSGGIRSFNAATTRRPWRTARRMLYQWSEAKLQCGHDPKAVEND